MPELPDIEVYVGRLAALLSGQPLRALRVRSAFWLRSVEPSPAELGGRRVTGTRRLGKRVVLAFEGELFAVLHLMIAGRLRWRSPGAPIPARGGLGAFDFLNGSLLVTEAGTRRRASLVLVRGEPALAELRPRGIEPLEASVEELRAALLRENRTLKRALTDPDIVAGVGNAYSDEILFAAGLSPVRLTLNLTPAEITALHAAMRATLRSSLDRLALETRDEFPEHVTAFRDWMAVHGRYGEPCLRCGSPVQRIRHAENESNYCARCQTGGKLLADRALSRLLRGDWPRNLDELEERKEQRTATPPEPLNAGVGPAGDTATREPGTRLSAQPRSAKRVRKA